MSEHIQNIAARIRELREISGYTMEEMAQMLSISAYEYAAYESGSTDIPISILIAVGEKFHVEVGTLLTGGETRLATYCLTKAGAGIDIARAPGYLYQALAHNFMSKKSEPFLVTLEPHQEHTPVSMNAHEGQEFDYVLEGTLKVVVGASELILNAGDSVYFNSVYPHGMQAVGETPAKFLAIVM